MEGALLTTAHNESLGEFQLPICEDSDSANLEPKGNMYITDENMNQLY